ncbi:unnamed protein product, partial [Prunus brigantina]
GNQIRIRKCLRAREDQEITSGQNAPFYSAHALVSKALTLRRKISILRPKTPTLCVTPYLESLLFLDKPQKVTGSGRNRDPKTGRISIRKSNYLGSKLMKFYPTIS